MSRDEAVRNLQRLARALSVSAETLANPHADPPEWTWQEQHEYSTAISACVTALATFTIGSPLPVEVQALAVSGRKLDAIRLLRVEHGIDLLLAKNAVEAFIAAEQLSAQGRLSVATARVPPELATLLADLKAFIDPERVEYDDVDVGDRAEALVERIDQALGTPPELPERAQ